MSKILIINGHSQRSGSPGRLSATFVARADAFFEGKGFEINRTHIDDDYSVEDEVEKLKWADTVFLQFPINWLATPWALKKYIDEVWMLGLQGHLSNGDGRVPEAPTRNYGLGGKLDSTYMLSITGNAPREAFSNPEEKFFDGLSEDDLFRWLHLNFKWNGQTQLPTFVAYDVMKNPQIERDFARFDAHLHENF
ncbi:NAD(P)H-dependent oxidoreductase [Sphingomonas sp. MG17]|uniref:NAD(P)H-dependent oxidoreductase n=2 Tax=Sphingomonas tagetis TaxID=2949092 RepID=A0A9X2KL64_9SPHN|nr:NAD(P)H-dependent oxidoreductase [Sphingomonas tagetis]